MFLNFKGVEAISDETVDSGPESTIHDILANFDVFSIFFARKISFAFASGHERPSEALCDRTGRGASPACHRDTPGTCRAEGNGALDCWGSLPVKSCCFFSARLFEPGEIQEHLADSSELRSRVIHVARDNTGHAEPKVEKIRGFKKKSFFLLQKTSLTGF